MKRSGWRYLWSARDIRRKLLITLFLLIIYRLAAHIPVPGADPEILEQLISSGGVGSGLISVADILSGGTVANFSILAMGVYPYITAQIILQLLVPIVPSWQRRMEDDPREGQKWMEKATLYFAIPMAALQAIGQINIFNQIAVSNGLSRVVSDFGLTGDLLLPTLTIIISMTAGTMFGIWLGELISEFGIRNQGLSLIIFAGIVARIPTNFGRVLFPNGFQDPNYLLMGFTAVFTALTIFAIVVVQQGRRNVPVMYPGRRVGNRMSMPVKGTLPLMINMAGMIPIIFASAILQFPAIVATFFTSSNVTWIRNFAASLVGFDTTKDIYWIIFFFSVVIFAFFYTDVLFAQQNYGENLKRAGAQIPGVSRGAPTQRYLTKVLRRITLPGAFFLGTIAVLPWLSSKLMPQLGLGTTDVNTGAFLVSSTGLLIVVGVVRDLFFNLDAELKLHGYDDSLLVR